MAPKRGGKRGASPSPKKARAPRVDVKLRAVVKALNDQEQVEVPGPPSNRIMLVEAVEHVLKSYVEERHAYQSGVAKMIGDVLKASQASWQKKVDDAAAGITAAQAEKEAADAAVKAAKEALEKQKEEVGTKKAELTAAKEAEKHAKDDVASATKDFKGHDAAHEQKIEEKTDFDKVYTDSFTVLKNPPAEGEKIARGGHATKITSSLKKLGAEPSLVHAVDSAIRKEASERGEFDVIAVDGADEYFKSKIKEKQAELDNGEKTKAEKEKTKMASEAMLEAASTKVTAAKEVLNASEEEKSNKSTALDDAKNTAGDKETALEGAQKTHDSEKKGLDAAIENVEAYTFLAERTAPAPAPEEAEAPAAGAA